MLGKNSGPGLGPPKAGRGMGTPAKGKMRKGTVPAPEQRYQNTRVSSLEGAVVHPKLKKNTKRGYLKGRGTF